MSAHAGALALLPQVYAGKRVLVTGHTGFKGSWLVLWLRALGAEVHGLALAPDDPRALFTAAGVERACSHVVGDVRDLATVRAALARARPEIVFHLAAQSLVRESYAQPLDTFVTNTVGTANLLEAVRLSGARCAVVVVTSDKAYENRETLHGYRETDPLGGRDPYSMSKGAAELVTASWRESFFPPEQHARHGVLLASARAGNVLGGGDRAKDRLVPDALCALEAGDPIAVRNPGSVRPWQHVLEPLSGYLLLGARLLEVLHKKGEPAEARLLASAFNFGPRVEDAVPVRALIDLLTDAWGEGLWVDASAPGAPHEAGLLRLSIDKAYALLGWAPRWGLAKAVEATVAFAQAQQKGNTSEELHALCRAQLEEYAA